MAIPTLTMIPSGYKAGKIYSVLPTNGDGDFTSTRSSSATRVNKSGLIETVLSNVPRLDYLYSSCPSLLIELPKTNNIRYSENTTASSDWTDPLNEWSSTLNTQISPSGELSADTMSLSASRSASLIRVQSMNLVAGTYAVSFWIKDIGGNMTGGTVDLGDVGGGDTTPSLSTVGSDWIRVKRIITLTSTQTRTDIQINFSGTSGQVSIWGLQIELGTTETSYIPTNGSTVTRARDIVINGGDLNSLDVVEGTLFLDLFNFDNGVQSIISISDGTETNKIQLLFEPLLSRVRTFSTGGVLYHSNLDFNQRNKIAITFKNNEYKTFVNGVLEDTDTSATVPTGMDRLNFASRSGGFLPFEGQVYDTRVYDAALSNEELIQLTTI